MYDLFPDSALAGLLIAAAEFLEPHIRSPLPSVTFFFIGVICIGIAAHFYVNRAQPSPVQSHAGQTTGFEYAQKSQASELPASPPVIDNKGEIRDLHVEGNKIRGTTQLLRNEGQVVGGNFRDNDLALMGPSPAFTGVGNEKAFQERMIREFYLSPGRVGILKEFIFTVGPKVLKSKSDDDLRIFWNEEVLSHLEKYDLNAGALTGLCSVNLSEFWRQNGANAMLPTGLSFCNTQHQITDTGLRILRAFLQNYN